MSLSFQTVQCKHFSYERQIQGFKKHKKDLASNENKMITHNQNCESTFSTNAWREPPATTTDSHFPPHLNIH